MNAPATGGRARGSRVARGLALAATLAFTAITLWTYAHVTGTYDTWRDLWFAERLVYHGEWPWQGPVIGNVLHLGPAWFYLIAPAYALGGPVGAAMFVALLACAKYPLGYALGRRLHGDGLGLAFVVALALPGWGALEPLMLTHTAIAQSMLVALVLSSLVLRERATPWRAAGYGALAALAVHAHPTMVTFVVALGLYWWLAVRPWPRAFALAAASLVVPLLSIAPLAWHAIAFGVDDASTVRAYADDTLGAPIATRVAPLVVGSAWRGVRYLVDVVLAWPPWLAAAALGAHALLLAIAAFGAGAWWRGRRSDAVGDAPSEATRRWLLVAVVSFLAQAIVLLWLRPFTPVWMVWPMLPVLAFAVAAGLVGAWRWRALRVPIALLCVIGFGLQFAAMVRLTRLDDDVRIATRGGNLMDVADAPASAFATITVPRADLGDSWRTGGDACGPTAYYGHVAAVIEGSFWLGLAHRCGDASRARIGGAAAPGRAAVLGLGVNAARAAACDVARHDGRLALLEVESVWTQADAWTAVTPNRYPPRALDGVPSTFVVEGTASRDDVVVVSGRVPVTRVVAMRAATVDGRAIAPRYVDSVTAVYRCDDCAANARWRLIIDGVARDTDVVAARCAAR